MLLFPAFFCQCLSWSQNPTTNSKTRNHKSYNQSDCFLWKLNNKKTNNTWKTCSHCKEVNLCKLKVWKLGDAFGGWDSYSELLSWAEPRCFSETNMLQGPWKWMNWGGKVLGRGESEIDSPLFNPKMKILFCWLLFTHALAILTKSIEYTKKWKKSSGNFWDAHQFLFKEFF